MNSRNLPRLLPHRGRTAHRLLPRRCSCGLLLLLLGLLAGPALAGPAPPPADTTRWIDDDDTPWLRGIRRVPMSHERSLAYWQAQVVAHPAPDLGRLVLLHRLAEAQDELGAPAAYAAHLAA